MKCSALTKKQPTADELLRALAIQTYQLGLLLEQTGRIAWKADRTFAEDDLTAARLLQPEAWMDGDGLVLRMQKPPKRRRKSLTPFDVTP